MSDALGPDDDYMWECIHCFMTRKTNANQTYASFSRDKKVIVHSARAHFNETGHHIQVFRRVAEMEIKRG